MISTRMLFIILMLGVAVCAKSSIKTRQIQYHWCTNTEEECKCMNNGNRFFINSGYFSGKQMSCRWLERKRYRHFNQCRHEVIMNNCPLSCGKCDEKPIPSTEAIKRSTSDDDKKSREIGQRKCKDSTKSFKIRSVEAIKGKKNCKWAAKKSSRCSIVEVREKCPFTCDSCGCFDNKDAFSLFMKKKEGMIRKSCKWVQRKDTWWRCTTFNAAMINCPQTCGYKCPTLNVDVESKSVENDSVIQFEITSVSPTNIPSLLPSTVPSSTPITSPTKKPSFLPSTATSSNPTTSPTKKPSLLPSTSSSTTPSILSSVVPSSAPSSKSSSPTLNPTIPYTCRTNGFIGKTLYASHGWKESGIFCYKVELFSGGTFSIDYSNPECTNASFTESEILSHYDSHDSKRFKFKKGDSAEWDGYVVMTSDPSVDELDFTIVKNARRQKIFTVHLHFPSCST